MGMMFKTALAAVGVLFAAQAAAEVTFFESEDFRGRSVTIGSASPRFDAYSVCLR